MQHTMSRLSCRPVPSAFCSSTGKSRCVSRAISSHRSAAVRRPDSEQAPAVVLTPPAHKALGLALAAAAVSLVVGAGDAQAARDKIGEFAGSGFLFKDSVEVLAIDDPDVSGVTLYISDFKRSITDKLAKDFFNEPSSTSLTCAITGPVVFKNNSEKALLEGKEVFEESKGFNLFKDKTQRVRRVYDAKRQSLVYVAYSTRLTSAADEKQVSGGRYRTSVCAVPLATAAPSVEVAK